MTTTQSSSSSGVKRVALVGATGQVGHHVLHHLLASEHGFEVTCLRRNEASDGEQPGAAGSRDGDKLKVLHGDMMDPTFLKEALTGQDALIITLSVTAAPTQQPLLVQAACDAGVKYVMLNAWGLSRDQPDLKDVDVIPDAPRQECMRIIEASNAGKPAHQQTAWLAMACGFWLDYSLETGFFGINIAKRTASLWDSGKAVFTTTTLSHTGLAVARVLALPAAALAAHANGYIHVHDLATSQRDLLTAAQRATNTTDADWTITDTPAAEVIADAAAELRKGNHAVYARLLYVTYMQAKLKGIDGRSRSDNEELRMPAATSPSHQEQSEYEGGVGVNVVEICANIEAGKDKSKYVQRILQRMEAA